MTSNTDVTCKIPVSIYKAEPYNLDWGAEIYAKITAINIYGNSIESD